LYIEENKSNIYNYIYLVRSSIYLHTPHFRGQKKGSLLPFNVPIIIGIRMEGHP
jgi:hypothetical protein